MTLLVRLLLPSWSVWLFFVLFLSGLVGGRDLVFFVDLFGFEFIFFLENDPDPGLLFLRKKILLKTKTQHLLGFYLVVPVALIHSVAGLNGR